MKNPLVSVIVPNYNYARYIDERMNSILNQTYKNFEIIILDDKSTDNSIEIIEKYRSNEHVSHIVYNDVNSGCVFKQWYKGLCLAKGELVWIAESDDTCKPNLLDLLVKEFEKDDNCVLAFSRSLFVNEHLKPIGEEIEYSCKREYWTGINFIKKKLRIFNIVSNASSALFRKDIGMSIDSQYMSYKGAGDLLFWIEICENGNVAIINECLNLFRRHNNSQTSKCVSNGTNIKELKRINDYLVSKEILSYKERFKSLLCVANGIIYDKFENENIRKELIKLWHLNFFIIALAKILHKIRK